MRIPRRPLIAPKRTEERLKLAASGLQLLAITLFVSVLLGSMINPGLKISQGIIVASGLTIGFCLLAAYALLRYISSST